MLTIQPIDESNLHDLNRVDGSFTVDARFLLHLENGQISYTVEPVPAYTKRYAVDQVDYATCIRNPDRIAYLAYVDGQLAGQIIMHKNWNRYAWVEDIAVDVNFRRQGIGRRLIEQVVAWAKAKELPGIMLETQNNNLAACRLYAACGFHLGGFDRELYRGLDPNTDEIALYWYLLV